MWINTVRFSSSLQQVMAGQAEEKLQLQFHTCWNFNQCTSGPAGFTPYHQLHYYNIIIKIQNTTLRFFRHRFLTYIVTLCGKLYIFITNLSTKNIVKSWGNFFILVKGRDISILDKANKPRKKKQLKGYKFSKGEEWLFSVWKYMHRCTGKHIQTQRIFSLSDSSFILQPQRRCLANQESEKPTHQGTVSPACPTKYCTHSELPENGFCKDESLTQIARWKFHLTLSEQAKNAGTCWKMSTFSCVFPASLYINTGFGGLTVIL